MTRIKKPQGKLPPVSGKKPSGFKIFEEAPVPDEFLNFLKGGRKFLIIGHEDPDGDCVGSQLALASALKRLGKEVILFTDAPFKRSEIKSYEKFFHILSAEHSAFSERELCQSQNDKAPARVVLLDCSNLKRSGKFSKYLENFPLAIIDHHARDSDETQTNGIQYVNESAPSTTMLVMKIMFALGLEINREEAEFLFFGLCTDTGFFRHVDQGGHETFEAAAFLIRSGANPKTSYLSIHGGKSLDSRKLIGHTLLKAEPFFDGRLIISSQEYEDIKNFSLAGRDSDSLYQLLLSVADTEAIVIIRQQTPSNCLVGLRSRSWVDVGSIARSFGGGGHKNASGFSLDGNIAGLKEKMIKAFESIFT